MALVREVKALVPILSDEANMSRTAEELAALLVDALDDLRAKSPRIAVVVRHRWLETDQYSLAVLGPFGATAIKTPRQMGEEACYALAHPGDGAAVPAPMYPSPKAAWDALQPPSRAEVLKAEIREQLKTWTPELWRPDGTPCPTCRCGLSSGKPCQVHPVPVR